MTYRPISSNRSSKRGFTLVEILVAITVLGILVGMLTPAVMNALGRAREAAINVEITQLDQAVHEFHTKYGFYPPTMGNISYGEFVRYVNRLSPNHAELSTVISSGPHSGDNLLQAWWEEIGQFLDDESSLVFWLSGICKNKQYPITNGFPVTNGMEASTLPPIAAHGFSGDGVERDIIYSF